MLAINLFSLQQHQGHYHEWPLSSVLYYKGQSLGIRIPGYVIEGQFALKDYYLLLVNWDCPFEEGYEVIVISHRLKVVGTYSFTPFLNNYLLSSISETTANQFQLVFNQKERFNLTIDYPKTHWFSRTVRVEKISADIG
ncbi:hypothetical protein [Bowmanella yangjiangensis]|uniref:Uncharacterized protein n=1 Tax=Bowmanella yangjiangensis TaxID=2811230 RepID=A0ABS3CU56_9ALTE|nr:hypothetical protein [Bowmanella yangjiangensis]MBN7820049.1 hypothetical protein [Bowmanella yangjiangensis]